jgi:hypothetical protein
MKVDLQSIDRTQFYVNEHIINGEMCYLVIPQLMGCDWTQDNKIFRSSLWNSDGELISASFPKFVNWGEKPEVFPTPNSLRGCVVMEKLDGSTLIVSKYKGQFIIRTRGTVDAANMEKNGHEIEIFKQTILEKLKYFFDEYNWAESAGDTWQFSVIFEWTSPLNQIVINYGDKPRFVLIGMLNHLNNHLYEQFVLDDIANQCGFERPATYMFTDVTDLISNVELWEGKEGVCVYSKHGQEIHKCKSFQYLKLHRFKSNATFENTVELFFEFDMPSYQEFEAKLIQKFDYECFEMVRGYISLICDGYKEVLKIIQGMNDFVEKNLKQLPNRREQAFKVFASYGKESNRSSFVFKILDGKQLLNKDDLKKLMYQVTKS